MCDIQEPRTPNYLLANLRLLFGIFQGSTHETTRYLVKIRNLILRCKLGGQKLPPPLINLIAVQHLDPSRYQEVMDGYKVGSIDWSSKNLEAIEMDLNLIDHCRRLVNHRNQQAMNSDLYPNADCIPLQPPK